jgi:PAS domain-containing protein
LRVRSLCWSGVGGGPDMSADLVGQRDLGPIGSGDRERVAAFALDRACVGTRRRSSPRSLASRPRNHRRSTGLGPGRAARSDYWINLPLFAADRLLGSIGLGLRSERTAPEEQLAFLHALGERAARGLANTQLISELRRTRRRLERILGVLAEAVTVHDERGKLVYANAAAATLPGANSVSELLDAEPGELAARFIITREDGTPVRESDLPSQRLIAGEHAPSLLTRSVERRTGREYWLLTKRRSSTTTASSPSTSSKTSPKPRLPKTANASSPKARHPPSPTLEIHATRESELTSAMRRNQAVRGRLRSGNGPSRGYHEASPARYP